MLRENNRRSDLGLSAAADWNEKGAVSGAAFVSDENSGSSPAVGDAGSVPVVDEGANVPL